MVAFAGEYRSTITCVNTLGSYECGCLVKGQQYSADTHKCINTIDDYCRLGISRHQKILNFRLEKRCRFLFSYWHETRDRDAVLNGEALCDPQTQICKTIIGSTRLPFECNCKNGYSLASGGICVDIDECVDGSRCPSGHECQNTVGMTYRPREYFESFFFYFKGAIFANVKLVSRLTEQSMPAKIWKSAS